MSDGYGSGSLQADGGETAESSTHGTDRIEEILEAEFPDRVYSVEEDVVWVSGMNANCKAVAMRMADALVRHDNPAGLAYDDGAGRFGGVQFNWGESA